VYLNRAWAGFFSFLAAQTLCAGEVRISSLPELQTAVSNAAPGTRIVVAAGVYSASNAIHVTCAGTASQPIVIAAESPGAVEITGAKGLELVPPAAYVTIEGFKFTHGSGLETTNGGGEMIAAGANHCRYTRNIFQLSQQTRGYYLMISGDDTEIDHNAFQNKLTVGQMIIIHGPGDRQMAQRTWIHHNFFNNFPNTRQNNCSAIQIGVSGRSLSSAHSLVEHNLFLECRGENENICNKSCDNVYRFNTFGHGCSELSLRHGDRNLVYANYFLGSEGLRIFGKNDKIYSNYFENCRRAIHIGNGDGVVPQSKLTAHDRPDGIEIVFNTVVNSSDSVMMLERHRNGLGATNIVFVNNLIVGTNQLVAIDGLITHSVWRGNLLWGNTNGLGAFASGFKIVDPELKRGPDGLFHLQAGSPAIGAATDTFAFVDTDIDGQPRGNKPDVGADQFSSAPAVNHVLTPAEVGPAAP
jgi:poly(beta-D-mannuronate) lyase